MNMSKNQAISVAREWLERDIGQALPVVSAFYIPAAEAGEPEGFMFDKPARWLVVFQCNSPEGFQPNQIGVEIDQVTGEVTSLPL